MKRRKKKKVDQGGQRWLLTYSDMVTLILVFFVLLFSMSQIDIIKFEAITESFRNRMVFDFLPSTVPIDTPRDQATSGFQDGNDLNLDFPVKNQKDEDEEEEDGSKGDELGNLMENIESYLAEHDLEDSISANRTERGVVLVLQERVLFNSGEAVILDSGKPFLQKVGSLLAEIPNAVRVEGHTDSRPISNYRYPSNWELSGARASSVIRYFIEEFNLPANRFSGAMYGETRPVVPNTSPENWQQNRRVEIVILDDAPELEQ